MSKFCPECGFEQHNDNNRYCSNCGFDFYKVENNIKSADNSSIVVPIDSDENSVSKTLGSVDSKAIESSFTASSTTSTAKGPSSSSTKSSTGSSPKTTKNYTSKSSSNDFLSKLTFNKCFLAFAVILIIFFIIGMFAQLDLEPSSDNGLTSFMERSNSYGLSDFIEDSNNYSDDYDYDYLNYGGDGDYADRVEN